MLFGVSGLSLLLLNSTARCTGSEQCTATILAQQHLPRFPGEVLHFFEVHAIVKHDVAKLGASMAMDGGGTVGV